MTEDEDRAQTCATCTHRKDAHWLHAKGFASVGKGKGRCAWPGCTCKLFAQEVEVTQGVMVTGKGFDPVLVPKLEWPAKLRSMIPGPIFTNVEAEDLELGAAELRTGWARHNPGIQKLAELLSLMSRTIQTKPKEGP